MTITPRPRPRLKRVPLRLVALLVVCALSSIGPLCIAAPAGAAVAGGAVSSSAPAAGTNANALETAASKAGETGRKVATSLIALAFAVAAIVLTFKRDFKEAVGVFAVGLVAVLLVTPAGINLMRDTVALLFGNQ